MALPGGAGEDGPFLSIVLVDTCGLLWSAHGIEDDVTCSATGREPLQLSLVIEAVILFLNSQRLLLEENELAVFAVNDIEPALVWESKNVAALFDPVAQGDRSIQWHLQYPDARAAVEDGILSSVRASLDRAHAHPPSKDELKAGPRPQLAAALSRALLYAHRLRSASAAGPSADHDDEPRSRILALMGSPDVPSQHVAVMNAIFAAKRSGVMIDACMLGHSSSSFLQQAADITGGTYLKPQYPRALATYLLERFSSGPAARPLLKDVIPGAEEAAQGGRVDLQASCFCHKRRVSRGWVCSVCLSIFCETRPRCPTCQAEFLAGERAGKRKAGKGDDGRVAKMAATEPTGAA